MKIALINPPMDFDTALGKARDIGKYTVMIPHGLASIAAVLRAGNIDVALIDAYAEGLAISSIVERVKNLNADVVGISTVTPVMNIVREISGRLKTSCPGITIVLGGPHPSILAGEVLADKNIDYVVRGEGERSFIELVRSLDSGSGVKDTKGVSYRGTSGIVHNPDREYVEDLDELPMPAYDMLPMRLYTAPPQWSVATPSYQLIATRGCPYACGFCCVGMGRKVRYKSAGRVCDEIGHLVVNHGARQIVFVDTTFPFSKGHALSVCGEMIKRGLNKKVVWFTSTRVDVVDQEMLDIMYRAGCRLITYGVESGNQAILDRIKKRIKHDQVIRAVGMARRAKIDITASYILGLPGETPETMKQTLDFAKKLNTLYAQFNVIVPYPGTEVFDHAVRSGLLRHRNWDGYVSLTSMTELEPPYVAAGLTKEGLLSFQKKAYNNYYLRPPVIIQHMGKLMKNFDVKKYMLLARVLLDTFK